MCVHCASSIQHCHGAANLIRFDSESRVPEKRNALAKYAFTQFANRYHFVEISDGAASAPSTIVVNGDDGGKKSLETLHFLSSASRIS